METTQATWFQGNKQAALPTLPAHLSLYLNDATYATEILPVLRDGQPYAVASYCLASGRQPDEPQQVLPPFASLYTRYPDKASFWAEMSPADYGLTNLVTTPYGEILGTLQGQKTPVESVPQVRLRYLALLERVLANGWLQPHAATSEEERTAAQQLHACTGALYDKLLWPYYAHVGREFLAWLRQAGQ